MTGSSPISQALKLLLWKQGVALLKVSLAMGALLAIGFSIVYWFEPKHNFDKVYKHILVPILLIAPTSCWLCLRDSRIQELVNSPGRKFLLLAGTSLFLYEILFWGIVLIYG